MPVPSVVVLTAIGDGSIVIETGCALVRAPQESCTSITAFDVPHCAGIPAMRPVDESSTRPPGNTPDATRHVGVPTRPVTLGDKLYATPTRPCGDAGMVSTSEFAPTVTVSMRVALLLGAVGSYAVTVNAPVCTVEGNPDSI